MISEGSCDTEDWSNDAETSALIKEINDISLHSCGLSCGKHSHSGSSSLSVGHYELCRDDIGDLLGSPDHL